MTGKPMFQALQGRDSFSYTIIKVLQHAIEKDIQIRGIKSGETNPTPISKG